MNSVIDHAIDKLGDCNAQLADMLDADVIAFYGDLFQGADEAVRNVTESIETDSASNRLVFLLTTSGGFIEVVERIVGTLRYHYDELEMIVPDFAYSAGTMLALSGDALSMDYYSRLGPIDPQITLGNGNTVPALGYLAQYEMLLEKARSGAITKEETGILMDFDQAELYQFDQARQLAVRLLTEWLVKYKLKDWTRTEGRGVTVDDRMRWDRAEEIANALSDISRWNSHSFGISMEVLRDDLKLRIDDYGIDKQLSAGIRQYDAMLKSYMEVSDGGGKVHGGGMLLSIP